MNRDRTRALTDTKTDVKVVLSALWAAVLFVFAYVDIFGFYRKDVIDGVLAGKISGTGFTIDQTFLLLTTCYIAGPALMVVVSLVARARVNRITNIVVSLVYAVSVAVTIIGETWLYYSVGTVIEVMLMLAITRIAWTWPRIEQL